MERKLLKFLCVVGVLLVVSCSENDEIDKSQDLTLDKSSSFVSDLEAINIANFVFSSGNKILDTKAGSNVSIVPIGRNKDKPSLYVINNQKKKGFIILSADKRTYPILAYSSENKFDLISKERPQALKYWLSKQERYIEDLRAGKVKNIRNFEKEWDINYIKNVLNFKRNNSQKTRGWIDHEIVFLSGPLLTTKWGQGEGYNNETPHENCFAQYSNGHTPTGCVLQQLCHRSLDFISILIIIAGQ